MVIVGSHNSAFRPGARIGVGGQLAAPSGRNCPTAVSPERPPVYGGEMSDEGGRPARLADVHELAMGMPHTKLWDESADNPVYQVGGKSFIFFRNPRPDAVDPETGERYPDVIVFWVPSESDKQALIQDETTPFFTTAHFDGHPSVLLRASRIGELTRRELAEVIQDAWLSRASARRAATWLAAHGAG
jgi:hypothetical protein